MGAIKSERRAVSDRNRWAPYVRNRNPGRGRAKTRRLWCYAVDDRPWRGPSHPAAAYVYSEDRKGVRPAGHPATFRGVLQVAGHVGFKRLAGDRADDPVRLAFRRAHTRRPLYEFFVSTKSPLAAEEVARIGELYAIEAEMRGHPAEHRCGKSEVDRLGGFACFVAGLREPCVRRLRSCEGHRYALRHWPGLMVLLDYGRVGMDTSVVERAIGPIPSRARRHCSRVPTAERVTGQSQ